MLVVNFAGPSLGYSVSEEISRSTGDRMSDAVGASSPLVESWFDFFSNLARDGNSERNEQGHKDLR